MSDKCSECKRDYTPENPAQKTCGRQECVMARGRRRNNLNRYKRPGVMA